MCVTSGPLGPMPAPPLEAGKPSSLRLSKEASSFVPLPCVYSLLLAAEEAYIAKHSGKWIGTR